LKRVTNQSNTEISKNVRFKTGFISSGDCFDVDCLFYYHLYKWIYGFFIYLSSTRLFGYTVIYSSIYFFQN